MRYRLHHHRGWTHYGILLGLGVCLWGSGYLMAQWQLQPLPGLMGSVQAQEASTGHEHGAHENLAPFMMRNAYHFSTLYHAGRAARWDLAAYQAGELAENLEAAAGAAPTFAGFLRDYQKDFVQPLRQAIETRQMQPFVSAFRAAVNGCNDCHKAQKHAYITIPEEPPNLSIFTFTPASDEAPESPAVPKSDKPHQGHKH